MKSQLGVMRGKARSEIEVRGAEPPELVEEFCWCYKYSAAAVDLRAVNKAAVLTETGGGGADAARAEDIIR